MTNTLANAIDNIATKESEHQRHGIELLGQGLDAAMDAWQRQPESSETPTAQNSRRPISDAELAAQANLKTRDKQIFG